MDWRILAFLVPILFVSYQSLSKLLPKGTSAFLVNAYASLIGFSIMTILFLLTSPDRTFKLSGKSLWLALGIGALIGIGNYGIIKAYQLGAPQSSFTLLFYVSLIVYGIIFGLLFWHEKLHALQATGILLAIVGVFMTVYFKK